MSFSTDIKKELSEINNLAKKEQVKYELQGYLNSNNVVRTSKKIKFSTESEYNINRFGKLLKNVDVNDYKIEIQGKVFTITANTFNEQKDISGLNEENFRAFIRGLYMGSGSINNPKNKYHLEIKIPEKKLCEMVIQGLSEYDINVKKIDYGIYIKEGEEISKLLAFIGASKSVLEFEQIRVQREMNNKINRLVNCKTANLNRVLNASVEQINAIKKLKESGIFDKIDTSLQELAELRLEYPDLPLSELRKKTKESNWKIRC